MNKSVLLIIRGAPGAGKSTIAQALVKSGLFHSFHEADTFYINSAGFYQYDRSKLQEAHKWCQSEVERDMKQGKNVIVSNTNIRRVFVDIYRGMAKKYGYVCQEMILPHISFESVHDVPQSTVERMVEDLRAEIFLEVI